MGYIENILSNKKWYYVLPESQNDHKEIAHKRIWALLEKLDLSYNNIDTFVLSFVHRSIVNEKPHLTPAHNERLEFLGDAVLELVITSSLFQEFPEKQEWELTDIRSALVRGRNLAEVANRLHFDEYLFLGKGEEIGGGRKNDYILANTLEAFIGAIYIDIGLESAEKFIMTHIYTTLDHILKNKLFKDFKTLVQEYTQAELDVTPTYSVIEEKWPDHDKDFLVGIYLWDTLIWQWNGTSKKKAQEKAAEDGYNNVAKK